MSRAESAHVPVLYDEMWEEFWLLSDTLAELDALDPSEKLEAASRSLLRTIRTIVEEVYRHDRWEILEVTKNLRDQRAMWNREIKKQRRKTG